ncbi:putative phage abortive infection protein, partial [Citrobacter sp. Awk 4]|uniref:putative phage abortive infection protein n=1 Tax=Citrobacter sp. Awk 4 TaxID=2963955 RepID=UPI00230296F1
SSIDDNSKKKYANILRAQLSNYELLMLLYNGNSKNGLKFKEYFNEYAVMDNLPVDKLISDAHVFFIEEKAWGDNHDALLLFSKAKQSKML